MPLRGETIGAAYVRILADGDGFSNDVKREMDAAEPQFREGGGRHSRAYKDGFNRETNKGDDPSRRLSDRIESLGNKFRKLGNTIGKSFGRGSRNDLLNFFGGFMSIIPRAMGALTDSIGSIKDWAGGIIGKFKEMRAAGVSLGEMLASLAGEGIPGLVIAAAVVAAAVQAMLSTIGILGSAVSLTSGLVLALAGSLAFGLVGGLVAVGGALIPFAAALGIGAAALASMDKKSKTFKTLKADFQDLQKTAQQGLFGKKGENLGAVSGVLKGLGPIVRGVAGALGGLLKQFGEFAKTKPFKNLISDMGNLLPGMVTQLGHIFGNLAIFIGEAFVAAGPIINEFLGWLEGISQKLVNFGKGGKKSGLAKFFDDAWASAKIVGSLILQIALAIGDLFAAGKGTGDSIFVELTQQVKDFRDWLKKAQADGSLQQFFDDAKRLADELGVLVGKVLELVSALDTPANRTMLFDLIGITSDLIGLLTTAAQKADEFRSNIPPASNIGPEFASIGQAISGIDWSGIGTGITTALSALPGLFTGLATNIVTAAGDISGAFSTWLSGVGAAVPGIITQITGFFTGLAGKIWTAAGDVATSFGTWITGVVTAIPGLIAQILGFFGGLAGKIITAAGDLGIAFGTWLAGLPVQVITLAGQIIVGFLDLAGRMITAAGDIIGGFTQWLADLPGKALQAAVNITAAFLNLAIGIINSAGDLAFQFGQWLATVPGKVSAFVASLPGLFTNLGVRMLAAAGNLAAQFTSWISSLPGKARSTLANIVSAAANLGTRILAAAGNLAASFSSWVSSLPGKARSTMANIISSAARLGMRIIAAAGNVLSAFSSWLAGLPGKARSIANDVTNAFRGLASKAIAKAGSIVDSISQWASGVAGRAGQVANDVVNAFRGLAGRIVDAIGTIIPRFSMPHITIPHITPIIDKPPGAAGFITAGPEYRLIGEAGPEAVVPLSRSLSQVDPAVRALSAIAQGKVPGLARGGVSGGGRTIDVGGITINTPAEDPRAVASEVVAHMAAASYL